MDNINQIRLEKLNKLAVARQEYEKSVEEANEQTRKLAIASIKEFANRAKEVYELGYALNRATSDKAKKMDSIEILVNKGNYGYKSVVRWYGCWHNLKHKGGLSYEQEGTSNDYYTIAADGSMWNQTSYGGMTQMDIDKLKLPFAVEFLDGITKWEKKLNEIIDSL